jgi:hypothetical protein
MRTICLVRSISIEAAPEAVIGLLSDARQLPNWAPRFARHVLPEGDQWVVEADDGTRTPIALRASHGHGTVDVLLTQSPPCGAYMRALDSGTGSELVLALVFPDPREEGAVVRQQQVVDDELRAVRDLAEATTAARVAHDESHAAEAEVAAGGPGCW